MKVLTLKSPIVLLMNMIVLFFLFFYSPFGMANPQTANPKSQTSVESKEYMTLAKGHYIPHGTKMVCRG